MSMNTSIKVACVQHAASKDQAENWRRTKDGIYKAREQGADLVALQELHTSIYFPKTVDSSHFELAQTIPGPLTDQISQLANELNLVIVSSIFEKRAKGIYHNTAVVYESDGSCAGIYRKMHIPDDPSFFEKFYFTPGDTGFEPINTSLGKLGVLVCWDQWFPEAARLMALRGADLLIYPTAIGWIPTDSLEEQQLMLDAWQTVQRGHAIANALPVLVCNRVGFEPNSSDLEQGTQFWGNSFICGPQGEILSKAQEQSEVIVADINNKRLEQVRTTWPFFRDRRVDAYEGILKIFDEERDQAQ